MTLELKNVQFYYPETPHTKVLHIEHWSVPATQHIFLHGPSGSGKSTLLNILSGLIRPSAGEVEVLGQRLDKLSGRQRDKFRANHIGYVFQQFNLIPYLNAIDNIQLAQHFAVKQSASNPLTTIQEILNRLNITEHDWYKPTAKLSIGQQQRVAIARALINKPELLIADEPTSSLDTANRDNFMEMLMAQAAISQTTVLFVSHDFTLSRHFSRVEALNEINHAQDRR